MLFKNRNNQEEFSIRPARLEDSKVLSIIQQEHSKIPNMSLSGPSTTPESIRLSIGSGLLNLHAYNVIEQDQQVIGFLQQKKMSENEILLGYPYVLLTHPQRRDIQIHLVEKTLLQLKAYGYRSAQTIISANQSESREIFKTIGFTTTSSIYQEFAGEIQPDFELESEDIEFRRVRTSDLDLTYKWIKRQLNPISPLAIGKDRYANLLYGPKNLREGWSIAVVKDRPVAMVSSLVDEASNTVIIFGPFNDQSNTGVSARIPLLNELLLYHFMRNRQSFRLMRIDTFDNDRDLIQKFNLKLIEQKSLFSKKL